MAKIALFLKGQGNKTGGVETHAKYFTDYFMNHGCLKYIAYSTPLKLYSGTQDKYIDFDNVNKLAEFLKDKGINVLFFNDGNWIWGIPVLRKMFPDAIMIMRSGGNEIIKAQCSDMAEGIAARQRIWAGVINENLDFIIANSAFTINRMLSMGIRKERIILVRGGVDIPGCLKNIQAREANRRRFDASHGTAGQYLIAIVSRLEQFKGIIDVLYLLGGKQDLNWHIVIAGDGRCHDEIDSILINCFARHKYTFLGEIENEQALELISIADALVNCSLEFVKESGNDSYIHTETMGRSMMEAICQNVPVIATDAGGTRELFNENKQAGILLEDIGQLDRKLPNIVKHGLKAGDCPDVCRYGWDYIFGQIYMPLMSVKKMQKHNSALAVDVDGTIAHDFLTARENLEVMDRLLSLRHECCIILNTAEDYEGLLGRYPDVKEVLDEICVIANCGKRMAVYGQECIFWKNYADSLFAPPDEILSEAEAVVEEEGGRVLSWKRIDRLYINGKITGVSGQAIEHINKRLKDTHFLACGNAKNLKIISKEMNKANSMLFLLKHILFPRYVVGAGNNILDLMFLELCDKAYVVNSGIMAGGFERVTIRDKVEMEGLIEKLKHDIGSEENFISNGKMAAYIGK